MPTLMEYLGSELWLLPTNKTGNIRWIIKLERICISSEVGVVGLCDCVICTVLRGRLLASHLFMLSFHLHIHFLVSGLCFSKDYLEASLNIERDKHKLNIRISCCSASVWMNFFFFTRNLISIYSPADTFSHEKTKEDATLKK